MKLGRIALTEAAGALVVHTLRLGEGVVFKKGRVLSAEDLERLFAAGHDSVIAARLDADDVPEDEAAASVGAAVLGDGLQAAGATTGRCNLHAQTAGLFLVDRERVDRLNLVDESVTLATIAPHTPVLAGDLVATVKIIPFAVPAATLARCITEAHGGLLRIAPFHRRPVGLVLTRLPGVHESQLDRAAAAQRLRIERVGGATERELRCEHDEAAVATALSELREAGCRLVLVLGASAIVDRRDVIPAAIERLGGVIEHFGLPVDPGNLLLLGRFPAPGGDIAVIGVPGCGRSLRRSGYDWVLERLCAELPVTRRDLMTMGVGGLLAEIPTRPQPRLAEERPAKKGTAGARIGAVVLAAGRSSRMGSPNKLLCELEGAPLITHMIDALLATEVRPIVVVTGHEELAVRQALDGKPVLFVHNPDFAQGMSTSLRAGLAALGTEVDAALICLGDMPRVRPAHIESLLGAFDPDDGRAIVVPTYRGQRGNPVLWAASFFPELQRLSGDTGARALLEQHAERVCRVPMEDAGVAIDVDTPSDLAALGGRTERS